MIRIFLLIIFLVLFKIVLINCIEKGFCLLYNNDDLLKQGYYFLLSHQIYKELMIIKSG